MILGWNFTLLFFFFLKVVMCVQDHVRDRKHNLKMVKHLSVGTALAEPFVCYCRGRRGAVRKSQLLTQVRNISHFEGMVIKAVSEIARSRRLQKETCTTLPSSALPRADTPVVLSCRWPPLELSGGPNALCRAQRNETLSP